MKKSISIKPPIILSIVLLLLSIFPFPYGYYVLLRLVVCLTAGLLSWLSYKENRIGWAWVMGFIVLLFNPIVPIHFERGVWMVFDVVVAVTLGIFLFLHNKGSNGADKPNSKKNRQDEISFGD